MQTFLQNGIVGDDDKGWMEEKERRGEMEVKEETGGGTCPKCLFRTTADIPPSSSPKSLFLM